MKRKLPAVTLVPQVTLVPEVTLVPTSNAMEVDQKFSSSDEPLISKKKMKKFTLTPTHNPSGVRFSRFQLNGKDVQEMMSDSNKNVQKLTPSQKKHMKSATNWWKQFLKIVEREVIDKNIETDLVILWIQISLEDDLDNPGTRPKYALDTFRDTYLPNWFRWLDLNNYKYASDLKNKVKNKIKQMLKNREIGSDQIKKQSGANPLCTWDLDHLVKVLPPGLSDRTEMLSWISVALHTGQRGISLINLKWSDIEYSLVKDDFYQASITFRRGKGVFDWNHVQTIESSISRFGSHPLFWLDQLWKYQCQDTTQSLLKSVSSNTYIFQSGGGLELNWRKVETAHYRNRMNYVTTACGYPPKWFSLHSTRKGFQVTAMLEHSAKGDSSGYERCFELISIALGYSPKAGGKNQMVYLRNAFRNCIISSRLINKGSLIESKDVQQVAGIGPVALNKLSALEFHRLSKDTFKSKWTTKDNCGYWFQETAIIKNNIAKKHIIEEHQRLCMTMLYHKINSWLCEDSPWKKEIKIKDYGKLKQNRAYLRSVKDWISTIANKYTNQPSKFIKFISNIVTNNELLQYLTTFAISYKPSTLGFTSKKVKRDNYFSKRGNHKKNIHNLKVQKDQKQRTKRKQERNEREENHKRLATNKSKSKRSKWTDKETEVLCKALVKYQAPTWRDIVRLNPELEKRSNVSCKDRIRSIKKQLNMKGTPVEVAERWLDENN